MDHRNPLPARRSISRRDFLKLAAASLGSLAARPWGSKLFRLADFPAAGRLGRVGWYWLDLKEQPRHDSPTVGKLYDDAIVPWLREVAGFRPGRINQRYVETPGGYVWAAEIMPVRNEPNQPLKELPATAGTPGMWVEVTVPYVDAILDNPPARSQFLKYRLEHGQVPRLYYSQILWVDRVKIDAGGQVWYRINERYGNPGDIYWAVGEAFRRLTAEEMAPISPDVTDKRIVVDINPHNQTMSCYEGQTEVYYCRVSTGVASGSTPASAFGSNGFPIWRKLHSLHMSGGTNAEGWDLPGIGWTALFHGEGISIHSTYWHNNFGEIMSHGCVNTRPVDAKWIFRWALPFVPFETGDNTVPISGDPTTRVTVIEG